MPVSIWQSFVVIDRDSAVFILKGLAIVWADRLSLQKVAQGSI